MNATISKLDELAGVLEEKGLRKFAARIDVVSNSIEAAKADIEEADPLKNQHEVGDE